ncbi:hypothetical protein MC885_006962 [Smutsia gigantea]|nr:hypothetical protein MC885_006962 [Smutsia gigantea]
MRCGLYGPGGPERRTLALRVPRAARPPAAGLRKCVEALPGPTRRARPEAAVRGRRAVGGLAPALRSPPGPARPGPACALSPTSQSPWALPRRRRSLTARSPAGLPGGG